MDEFLEYLRSLDVNKQMRMLFMLEASIYLCEDYDYDTNLVHAQIIKI